MSRFHKAVIAVALIAATGWAVAQAALPYTGVGRTATPKEVKAWDIDVRADFKGLPSGSGSVAKGQDIWEAQCASCHGFFGESGSVFSPLVGGITPEDIKTGHVANLTNSNFPGRTTFMKVATISTVWDYINRAMPWNAPKSLTTDEVYAVTAFLLNLNGIVPDNFTFSDKNIAEVQARMPNRNGMTTAHSLWPGTEFNGIKTADTRNVACMSNCAPDTKVASFLPDFARNAHGNLAEQNRGVGAQFGVDTTRPEAKPGETVVRPVVIALKAKETKTEAPATSGAAGDSKAALALLQSNNCMACHAVDRKVLGPSFIDIGKKHAGKVDYLAGKIKAGSAGVWGPIPMPAQSLSDADTKVIATWLAAGAKP